MEVLGMEQIPVVTKCNTCKAAFSTVELVREHYRTDWHVFNSKRRANNLGHVTLEEYRKQFPVKKVSKATTPSPAPSAPASPKKEPTSSPQKPSALKSPQSAAGAAVSAPPQPQEGNENQVNEISESLKEFALHLGVESDRVNTIVASALVATGNDRDDEERGEEVEEEQDQEDETEPIVIEPNVSIFDNKEFPTVEACLEYMERTFGFFIPEREYLVDLPGFLVYLGEKVKIGGLCLYCQKQFTPGRPLQNHMLSKSHCKIAYQENVDEDEFEDFYDFSSSYGPDGKKTENEDDEDDDLVDQTLEISAIGELILTDGRTVGHRAFRKYYRQKHKPIDNRLSIAAQRREEASRFQTSFRSSDLPSLAPGALNGMDLRRLSDTEIMSLLIKKHKEMRRMQQIEQRAQRRQEYRYHRAEYLSVKDQLRARINVTDKIRDYHGMLM
jgi:pre-60S factor REI1